MRLECLFSCCVADTGTVIGNARQLSFARVSTVHHRYLDKLPRQILKNSGRGGGRELDCSIRYGSIRTKPVSVSVHSLRRWRAHAPQHLNTKEVLGLQTVLGSKHISFWNLDPRRTLHRRNEAMLRHRESSQTTRSAKAPCVMEGAGESAYRKVRRLSLRNLSCTGPKLAVKSEERILYVSRLCK